jgi:hypothetical protein
MAGIIDSFFVQVGLDASQFTIGQREADKAWTKTKDQTVAAAKQIEENTRRLATSFETLKRIIRKFSKRRLTCVARLSGATAGAPIGAAAQFERTGMLCARLANARHSASAIYSTSIRGCGLVYLNCACRSRLIDPDVAGCPVLVQADALRAFRLSDAATANLSSSRRIAGRSKGVSSSRV